jgi:hypothetical protein
MNTRHYDIVRKEHGRLVLIEEAPDLEHARFRIRELASFWPGEFQVMDQHNHQPIAKSSDAQCNYTNETDSTP